MTPLWTASDFVAAVSPSFQPGTIDDVMSISIDSRTVVKGDAFFAIKGDRFDGHGFARAALDSGASVVVLDDAQRSEFLDIAERVVFVDDVLSALERLGKAARARVAGRVIAITGSVGKTSTKDALRAALAPSGSVHAAVSSFNNHWGVPLTLARMPKEIEFGVIEVGMNHPGEIRNLIAMVKPHLAVITTIVAAHIGNFDSIDEIAAAKAEIFEGVVAGGAVLINGDNRFSDFLSGVAKAQGIDAIHRFGRSQDCDVRLLDLTLAADGSDLSVSLFGNHVRCHVAAPGEHLALNALSVLGAVSLSGGDVTKACEVLARHGASKGRGERHSLAIEGGTVQLIDESYNANPASVSAALATLALSQGSGRKIAVLGDMLELGDDSIEMHKGLVTSLENTGLDRVYLCGPMMAHLWEIVPIAMRATYANSSADLIAPLVADICDGDVVMVKGSLGSRMGPIVAALLGECKR
ncbi:UDP-N-acetylmuramoylalanyl-D-glutamyl-2,6-diaminopimelate--D-alanyl-D-alanine ligase [Cohaesibacter celericrescens]|uniref:UDP-N-acetylmuramoyl-tripeptide--D-alanyl-D-alanine ligase n=1 Tax=Cohaesibacter celericrescens TaxID=2067669 RepID=A0A2N5XM00_9HYPH|nr:UDP-N-acetylmuramoylalanyl-D-glutamyl-2,6-diaminopimelate--D-alanyl-D-alanine ligase [Cohaesibacter celericrescens]PLW75549.1 UDP-N-acetylmuramoylalanyl-D-glutamyl-2, 6-diaminopimelate--D-alanyl-D-alanine ligase [Cohaesibacter celericrescens]PLW78956.1 UDP-N-acetylmuramoylalanyl-D-glutamyl-2, 6-diaminopimelate--D-alanyl-D-alanine ligase [Cohaesibacter celericrescens]